MSFVRDDLATRATWDKSCLTPRSHSSLSFLLTLIHCFPPHSPSLLGQWLVAHSR